jgi:hypothetical protein
MTKCKFYSECKNQQLLWDLHVGITRDTKNNQRLLWRLYAGIATNVQKTQWLLWDVYAGIATNVQKTQWLLWDLYAGIAMNEDYQRFFVTYMQVLKGMQNASGYYGTFMGVLQ